MKPRSATPFDELTEDEINDLLICIDNNFKYKKKNEINYFKLYESLAMFCIEHKKQLHYENKFLKNMNLAHQIMFMLNETLEKRK